MTTCLMYSQHDNNNKALFLFDVCLLKDILWIFIIGT